MLYFKPVIRERAFSKLISSDPRYRRRCDRRVTWYFVKFVKKREKKSAALADWWQKSFRDWRKSSYRWGIVRQARDALHNVEWTTGAKVAKSASRDVISCGISLKRTLRDPKVDFAPAVLPKLIQMVRYAHIHTYTFTYIHVYAGAR